MLRFCIYQIALALELNVRSDVKNGLNGGLQVPSAGSLCNKSVAFTTKQFTMLPFRPSPPSHFLHNVDKLKYLINSARPTSFIRAKISVHLPCFCSPSVFGRRYLVPVQVHVRKLSAHHSLNLGEAVLFAVPGLVRPSVISVDLLNCRYHFLHALGLGS